MHERWLLLALQLARIADTRERVREASLAGRPFPVRPLAVPSPLRRASYCDKDEIVTSGTGTKWCDSPAPAAQSESRVGRPERLGLDPRPHLGREPRSALICRAAEVCCVCAPKEQN